MQKKTKFLIGGLVFAGLSVLNFGAFTGIGPGKEIYALRMKVKPGNADAFALDKIASRDGSLLTGMHGAFLGSSVTYGAQSFGQSFVEYLCKRNNMTAVKEAVSGTTLSTKHKNNYIHRMVENIDPNERFDFFICQLSTNDATRKVPLGNVSESFERADFNTETVAGALEYIASYVKDTWGCPLIFYTGTRYDSKAYADMVDLLFRLQEKWSFGVIDLWDESVRNSVSDEEYDIYMGDPIHPTRAGYLCWWTPIMEQYLEQYLTK